MSFLIILYNAGEIIHVLAGLCGNQNGFKFLKYFDFSLNQLYSIKKLLKYAHLNSHKVLDSQSNIHFDI